MTGRAESLLRNRCSLLVVGCVIAASAAFGRAPESGRGELNPDGVLALLTVMDVVAALHPGFESLAEDYDRLPESARDSVFAAALGPGRPSRAPAHVPCL